MLKISEFSKLSHLTIKALRYYEKEGLLTNVHLEEDIRLLSAMVKKKERTDSPLADESLKYLFGADEEYILSFYREAEKKYGSMEDFLRGRLGVTDEDRAAMQEMYLV